ncbi:MAG TPA: ABC transporter substrate-binding protein [Dehalococcoidales bacterium]|nr:ABC transporter substrate-binding protein [Dehalococcoidales bacterium]
MKKKALWVLLTCLMVAALVLSSCQAATVEEEKEGETVTGTVIEKEAPKVEEEEEVVVVEKKKEMVLDPATHKMVTKPEYGGTLTFVTGTDPPYIDPWNGSAGVGPASYFLEKLAIADWAVDRDIFSWQSTSYFPESIYRGQIAESWEQVSPTHFVIHIREGVNWQNLPPMNGRELTAYDVEWSYHRTLGMGSGFTVATPNATGMLGIPFESITATDKYTVEVKLKSPVLTALKTFLCESYEGSWVYPPEVIQQYGNLNDWHHLVGSGPFMIFDHVIDSSWTWVKNPDYWGYDEKFPENKIPYVDRVRQLVIPDYQTQVAALRAGKIDYLSADIENAKTIRNSNPELVEHRYFSTGQVYPIDATLPPLDDVRVRKAMQMAINMEEIADTYYEGLADPTPYGQVGMACVGYYLPYSQWTDEWKAGYEYNLQGAKDLMAQAGYPNGFKLDFNLFPSWVNADVLQIVQGYWKELGITLDVKTYDWAAYSSKVFSKSAGPLGSWYGCVNYEPMAWIKVQFWSGNPWSFPVGDPDYDALVMKADNASTSEDQVQFIQDCEAYAIPKHWMIIVPRTPSFGFVQPWYKGFNGEGSLGGGLLSATQARFWIDQDLKYEMTGVRD